MAENECKHDDPRLKGAWCEPIAGTGTTRWRIGWCCATCGHVEQTGTVPSKPYWAVKL